MRIQRLGFTLIELLVVISIIALLIGILLPALSAARKTAQQMTSNTRLRGMHQGLVVFAQSNNTWYPGLTSNGQEREMSGQPNGFAVQPRYNIMMASSLFPPEYMMSPLDPEAEVYTGDSTTDHAGGGTENNVQIDNYSYSLLELGTGGNSPTGHPHAVAEWNDNLNGQAVVISDRAIGEEGSDFGCYSLHTLPIAADQPSNWRGGVAWNDGHVTFESSHLLVTRYNGRPFTSDFPDDIFMFNTSADGHFGARMIIRGRGGVLK